MRATFSGIEIARRALQAQQASLDTVGQNIANANTPGYSRQVAVHRASQPYAMPQFTHNPVNGMMGTGVEIAKMIRMRDEFVEMRLRQELYNKNYWEMISDGLEQVELIFNEPGDNGIHRALEHFWDAWQELSINP
ncbi:MAG: flagellar hook-associated protein FlgK, partial [Firmicutes bacterium]|nr:flagellar hook-associated protein FlgK [Bacillota bacterium]